MCGAENLSQGPWEPGALRAALSQGGQATAEGALLLPFDPSYRTLTSGALGSALLKDAWDLSAKARQEQC